MTWVLVFVLVQRLATFNMVYDLERYATEEECQAEQVRIAEEMKHAYPDDVSYYLECRMVVRGD